MALATLAELAQSYSDLKWHLDPVAATRAGLTHYDDRFGRFAADALRPHVVALKALTAALEELEPEELDDEIDRTALLNDARVLIYRCERERVFARDPGQWVERVIDGALPTRLGDLPGFLDDARAALVDPVALFASTALESLPLAVKAVRQAAFGAAAPAEAERQALAMLQTFREDLERWADSGSGHFAVGEDAFNFHLHFEHALRETAPELWRYGHRLLEELDKTSRWVEFKQQRREPVPPLEPDAGSSLVRRLVRSTVTVAGRDLYGDFSPERLRLHAAMILVDVGLHTRGMTTAQAGELLSSHLPATEAADPRAIDLMVRFFASAPTAALSGAVGLRDFLALHDDYQRARGVAYRPAEFYAAVRVYGALPPSLIRWGMGLGE